MKKYALTLTSKFNSPEILKFRILMLYQKNTPTIALSKFLWAVPLIVLCIFVSALMQRSHTEQLAKATPAPHQTPATYTIFSSVLLEANTAKKLVYSFTKEQEYMFLFIDLKTQSRVSPPADFRMWDINLREMRSGKFTEALHYLFKNTGEYNIAASNTSNSPILLKIYVRDRKVLEKEILEKKLQNNPLLFQHFVIPEQVEGEGC